MPSASSIFVLLTLAISLVTHVVASEVEFDRTIAPLLAKRCLECHKGEDAEGGLDLSQRQTLLSGGESGAAITIGSLDQSLLWQRIEANEMPPEHPLSRDERILLRRWIEAGVPWDSGPIDPWATSNDQRAGRDWWAFQPIKRPPFTESGPDAIDRLVRQTLEEAGLEPSQPATPRELLRRLSIDLIGLPPTPEQVDAFQQAVDSNGRAAVSNEIDRLLSSHHYGERWARHWLDIARFGESHGFERDSLRENSWHYRDWVINQLNRDVPYDDFVRNQLAGDVLHPKNPGSTIATGFLVAGAWDEVGQTQQSAAMKAVVRQDELEDYVGTIGQAFLGLTINCARCHDHKFDPITQREYYRIAAALAGVRPGSRYVIDPKDERRGRELDLEIQELEQQIRSLEQTVRRRLMTKRGDGVLPPDFAPVARWEFDSGLGDCVGNASADAYPKAKTKNGHLVLNKTTGFARSRPQPFALKEKTLEAWVRLSDLSQRGGSLITIHKMDNKTFDAVVYGERKERQWMAGSDFFRRTQDFNGPDESEADQQLTHVAVTWASDGTITGYRNGEPYGKPYKADHLMTFEPGQWFFQFGLRVGSPGAGRQLRGELDTAQVFDRALTVDEIRQSYEYESHRISRDEILAAMNDDESVRRDQLDQRLDETKKTRESLRPYLVYAVKPRQPESTHLLGRGNPGDQRDEVAAGGVAAITGVDPEFGLKTDSADQSRRAKLAYWITDENNPLFARVIVNRLWHHHFGVGIIDSPNDFGFNGGRPSHPELLDWLAAELIDSGFRLKHIHRLILNSKTYQQASQHRPDCSRIDRDNRLLWRYSPRRLDAETLRDSILFVAGQINLRKGGPPYRDFETRVHNSQFYEMVDRDDPDVYRRTIYRTWIRSGRSHLLDVFDCPDPSTTAPKRTVTTTPLQALTLMNNSFMLRMADRFAERIVKEAGSDTTNQIAMTYRIAYGRSPSADESEQAVRFVQDHTLPALCRVVLNSNEFIHVD